MKKNIGNIIITALFIIIIYGMSIGTLIAKDRTFSEVENRNLSSAPKFTMAALIDGSYGTALETYSSDQLILKDKMVMFKNQLLRATGRTRINNVYLAKHNMFIQEYREDKELLEKNIKYIKDWCENSNFDKEHIYMLLAPNASELYPDAIPAFDMNEPEKDSMDKAGAMLDKCLTYVNPAEELKKHLSEKIYYKTDHHWTMLGAHYGYEVLADAMGNTPVALGNMREVNVEEPFYGSLFSQAPTLSAKPDSVTFYDYKDITYSFEKVNYTTGDVTEEYESYIMSDKLNEKDKYAALFGGNYAYTKLTNNNPDKEAKGRTLLVFKDSYANSILPYLISDYEMIDVIDLRFFDYMSNSLTELSKNGLYDDILFMYNISFLNSDKNFMGLSN